MPCHVCAYHQRPIGETIDELESLAQREVYIVDDDFLVDAVHLERFLDELERRNLKRGMISLCVGGGMGISTIIERV